MGLQILINCFANHAVRCNALLALALRFDTPSSSEVIPREEGTWNSLEVIKRNYKFFLEQVFLFRAFSTFSKDYIRTTV